MPKAVPYTKGSIIFFEGDRDDRIFILQTGSVVLKSADLISGVPVTEQIHVGEFFGVKSALSHMPRMETASVSSDSTVVMLSVPEFEKIFGTNQELTLKMLRVFSKTLRQLHSMTGSILHNNDSITKGDEGMLTVARSFFESGEYYSCKSVLSRIPEKFPETALREDIEKLEKECDSGAAENNGDGFDKVIQDKEEGEITSALKQFSLPMFDRFTHNYTNGDIVICEYEPGEKFYLIKSGEIQVVKCINGAKKNLDILRRGEFFGEMAILDNSPRGATCMSRGNTVVLEFNKENFKTIVTGNPMVVMLLLKIFCKRIYDQRRRIRILTITDISARIADVFLMYNEMMPVSGTDGSMKRRFNISTADVAQWAALSVETARDELNKYVERNKLEIFDGYMNVSNIMDMKRTVDSYYSSKA